MSRGAAFLDGLARDERGTTAIEFALIAILLLLTTFGVIDFGLAYWQWNMAEKATQIGTRKAVVSDLVAGGLATYPTSPTSSAGTLCMNQSTGAVISDCSFSPVTCTSNAAGDTITCTCPATPCPNSSPSATAFTAIVAEMQKVDPYIANNNVEITYSPNGLGFVGQNPLPVNVTVMLTGMTFRFFVVDVLAGFPGQFTMPPFKATLTGEDLSSTNS